MAHTVCLIPGDGIGPEMAEATCAVIDASGAAITWMELPAGAGAVAEHGDVLPEITLEAIGRHKVALKGPVTTPIGTGFRSVNVQLRKQSNLYGAIRPMRSMPGVKTRYTDVELVVIRENAEGLHSGIENGVTEGMVTSLKVATAERIKQAYDAVLEARNPREISRDIGGEAGTDAFAAAVIARLEGMA